jgi:hypothetical protein
MNTVSMTSAPSMLQCLTSKTNIKQTFLDWKTAGHKCQFGHSTLISNWFQSQRTTAWQLLHSTTCPIPNSEIQHTGLAMLMGFSEPSHAWICQHLAFCWVTFPLWHR